MTDSPGDDGDFDRAQPQRPTVAVADAASTVRVPWFRRPWALEVAGAAAIVLTLAGYALLSVIRAPARDGSEATVADVAIAVVKPTTAGVFDRTFAWQRVAAATSYRVVVSTANADPVFELRDLKVPSVKLAESVKLTPGDYVWQVAAFRDGVQVSESLMTKFAVP